MTMDEETGPAQDPDAEAGMAQDAGYEDDDYVDDNLDEYRDSGRIAAKVRDESRSLIMVGETYIDIAENIEQMIREEGAVPAFPVTISVNEVAAHYAPPSNDQRTINDGDLVKIDLGVSVNNALTDTAYTLDLSDQRPDLVGASRSALDSAISAIKPGARVSDISAIIEDTITGKGFRPISNLSGHMIRRGLLHAGVDIPNVRNNTAYRFKPGDVFAVEPFATEGSGQVSDLEEVYIFSLYMPNNVRMQQSRKVLKHILGKYAFLPFSERWLQKEFTSRLLLNAAMRELLEGHVVQGFPVLKDIDGAPVSQAEHTVLVTGDGAEILTK
ncbi:MAG: type II methionyl aminopeptidase [Candidatus Bilamarchaeaceae archaeon]